VTAPATRAVLPPQASAWSRLEDIARGHKPR
jgi:hypothetical protein